ncbi:MAG: hypothetical protein CVU00_13430 [Bacteroidetes bacterium HGW-Bacteroidetes-17]|jgi:hypothetical protein|nr:MAG: hypothetical protein CVU00_13430 [Bacteroidetes bacterium HGW-Bacteroidetes-17]
MTYKIFWEDRGLNIKWSGIITDEEIIRPNGEIYGNKLFENIDYQIADFLNATPSIFSVRDILVIYTLEKQASRWNKKLMVAHIARDPEFINSIKAYESKMINTGWKFGIFDNLGDTRKWVNA